MFTIHVYIGLLIMLMYEWDTYSFFHITGNSGRIVGFSNDSELHSYTTFSNLKKSYKYLNGDTSYKLPGDMLTMNVYYILIYKILQWTDSYT